MHFWQVVTRWLGGVSRPRKYFFSGAMPELMSSRLLSFLWHQRNAWQAGVALALKEGKELLAQIVESCPFHRVSFSFSLMIDNLFGKSSRVKAGTLEKQKSPRPDWDEG